VAYLLIASPGGVKVTWVGDGTGQMAVPGAQSLTAAATSMLNNNSLAIVVPGGDSPTSANIQTACTSLGTALGTFFTTAANLATIQGWSTGGQ
jgi:hypothetical protein